MLLLDVLVTPFADICVDEWAWPFVLVDLIVPWMKVKFAICTVFCNDFKHHAFTVRAHDLFVRSSEITRFDDVRFPKFIDEWNFCG